MPNNVTIDLAIQSVATERIIKSILDNEDSLTKEEIVKTLKELHSKVYGKA